MELSFIRHSLTQGNLEKRYLGRHSDPSLCQEGIALAEQQKAALGEFTPERLFVSPMKRCVETAKILFPNREMTLVPDFAECDFGTFEGKNYRELADNPDYQAWIDSGGTLPFPEGESREAFVQRCCCALASILEQGGFERAAVVAHGGTFMAILSQMDVSGKGYFDWKIPHCIPLYCTVLNPYLISARS